MHSDEFVLELLASLDKLSTLVQELLVIEVRRSIPNGIDCHPAVGSSDYSPWLGLHQASLPDAIVVYGSTRSTPTTVQELL